VAPGVATFFGDERADLIEVGLHVAVT